MLTGTLSDSPATAPATKPAAPAAVEAPVPAKPVEPAQPAAPAAPEATQPVDPAKPAETAPVLPEKPAEVRLYAKRFKTVEELEGAYDASGQEARRLHQAAEQAQGQVKTVAGDLEKVRSELAQARLELELGPEIKDPTPEEMATWDAQKVGKFYHDKTQRDIKKQNLERDRKGQEERAKGEKEATQRHINTLVQRMAQDAEKFPRFSELEKSQHEVMDMLPQIVGHVNSPFVIYLASYGYDALQRDTASKKAAAESKRKAETDAAVKLPAAAGAGSSAPAPETPKPIAKPTTGSDEEHVANLLASHSVAGKPTLPLD